MEQPTKYIHALWYGIFAMLIGLGGLTLVEIFFTYADSTEASLMKAGFYIVLIISILYIMQALGRIIGSAPPKAHEVAILGFPKSGKTTLLITLFSEIQARKINILKIRLSGNSTIEKYNELWEKLKKGEAVGPTTDQDRFAFRTILEFPGRFTSKAYKVEFGDFPGEDSKQYFENYGKWLHTTEFFKWAAGADAMIFVVDLARYLEDKVAEDKTGYVATTTAAIRAAWQQLLDLDEAEIPQVRKRPVALVFTKSDLFNISFNPFADNTPQDLNEQPILQRIASIGFGDKIPPLTNIYEKSLNKGKDEVQKDFSDLIRYLESEAKYFNVIFTSSFGILDEQRLGLSEVLNAVLPK